MPKRIIDKKTGIAETAKEKAARMRDNEGVSRGYDQDEDETRGIDEDLANPELESAEDDEEDDIRPPPLDGRPPKL